MTIHPSISTPREPYLVYLDTTTLVDWLLPTEPRHLEAKELMEIFHRYQAPACQIRVLTSQWALTEAHSVLYRKLLEKKLGIRIRDIDSRRHFPPDATCLQKASDALEKLKIELPSYIFFRVDVPDNKVWEITYELARQTGIYPADSLHVATAIQQGCSILVASDQDLLNKIAHYRKTAIEQLLQDWFPASKPPTLEVCPLVSPWLRTLIPTARMCLQKLGYV